MMIHSNKDFGSCWIKLKHQKAKMSGNSGDNRRSIIFPFRGQLTRIVEQAILWIRPPRETSVSMDGTLELR
jgi:hypothetical protein